MLLSGSITINANSYFRHITELLNHEPQKAHSTNKFVIAVDVHCLVCQVGKKVDQNSTLKNIYI